MSRLHRATTLERRDALLRAAAAVVAERGVGGATHRAIAARAGVPLGTTSYFFASIDDLLLEALRLFVADSIERLERATAALHTLDPAKAIDLFVAGLMAVPQQETVAQFETYLEVARRPELAAETRQVIGAYERLAATALELAGVERPAEAARSFVALADGFALARVAQPQRDGHAEALRAGLLALLDSYARLTPE
jgi:DNA-binding transcriptional regulator YbjK